MGLFPTRSEQLTFRLTLDRAKAERHAQAVQNILQQVPSFVGEGDTLHLNYDLHIEYWGNVVNKLNAIRTILSDPEIVIDVGAEEMLTGECLIQQVFEALSRIREVIEQRKNHAKVLPDVRRVAETQRARPVARLLQWLRMGRAHGVGSR